MSLDEGVSKRHNREKDCSLINMDQDPRGSQTISKSKKDLMEALTSHCSPKHLREHACQKTGQEKILWETS